MRLVTGWMGATLLLVQPGEIIDRVLAIVAGDVITLSDVVAARDLGFVAPASAGGDPSDATREVLTALIERALVLAEVERYAPPEPASGEIDRRLQSIRVRFQTPEAFSMALARAGLEDTHLRERLRQDLRIEAYLAERFAAAGRDALVRDWIAGLRRRSDIVDLYKP
jgi:hypothetical protein